MDQQHIAYLVERLQTGAITASELAELRQLLLSGVDGKSFVNLIAEQMEQTVAPVEFDAGNWEEAVDKIIAIDKPLERARVRSIARNVWWVAASVLIVLSVGTYFWLNSERSINPQPVVAEQTKNIQPGMDGAILTLADGREVSLDSLKNGVVALQGGATAKVENGVLVYEGVGDEIMYNRMSTPRGRQYQLTLPDGTGVWLNAASSIRYPTVFAGKERKVEISGEAYLEVVKDKEKPFLVSINGQTAIEVLGTKFNVNAYADEHSINTTLLEGSIQVKNDQDINSRKLVLKPGQQAQIPQHRIGISVIDGVDLEQVMAWKNGFFQFEKTDIRIVMRQLARWYDIEVVYDGDVEQRTFSGTIRRNMSMSKMLDFLNLSDIHAKVENGKLIIQP